MTDSILACSACLRRVVQLLIRQKAAFEATSLFQNSSPIQIQRRFATADVATAITNASAPRTLDVNPAEPTVSQKKNEERLRRIVKKQLSYIDDPWKIAQHVEATLKKDRFDEALLLTQTASKDRQVVVAWNHLIDYMMGKQQLKKAIKLYNDMKKRAQLPNVQTYTILFRGCAKSVHPQQAVAEAIKHYHILMRDKRIQPNAIHLNAVLNVCGKAGDLDSMFAIVDTANDSTRAPTTYTYTTILNALRHQALKEIKDLAPEQADENLDKMVSRAKAIWEEVVDKWHSGRIVIDEELVCAMGRVLLLSPDRREKREVLDLLEQTMGIPNMARVEPESAKDYSTKGALESEQANGVAKRKKKMLHAEPGTNTLALVLTALASSRLTTCGIKYWNYLIREHSIVPDNDNWMRMFGMLKVARASAHAYCLLDAVPDSLINGKHCRIAIETCVRDNINHNALKNANHVLDIMVNRLSVPDCHTMRLYLRVALVSHYGLRLRAKQGDAEASAAKRDYGVQITEALARLWDPYMKTHEHYFEGVKPRDTREERILYNDKREVIALARNMYSAFNKVIEERMLPEVDLREIRPIGARINREIQRFYSNREELEPNLRRDTPQNEKDDEGSRFEYVPAGDFIWDTTKSTEEVAVKARNGQREGARVRWPK